MRAARRASAERTAAAVLAFAGLAAVGTRAEGQIHWNNSAGGNWSNALNWTPNNVPDSTGEAAVLDAAGSYVVVCDASYSVRSVSLPLATVQLGIADGRTLGLGVGGLSNSGVVRINLTGGNNGATLGVVSGHTAIGGTGVLELNATPNLDTAVVTSGSSSWELTNGATHTMRGTGRILAAVVNEGVIDANRAGLVLHLGTNTKANNNLLTATAGVLDVTCPVSQGASGRVEAAGGTVRFAGASVTGGRVGTVSGATRITGNSWFTSVTTSGVIDVVNGYELLPSVTLTNNGTIVVNDGVGAWGTGLRQNSGALALNGTGAIVLRAGSNLDAAYLVTNSSSWTLTQAGTHTIRGSGKVFSPVVNNGTINADQSGGVLWLGSNTKTNNSLMTATGGGYLDVACVVGQAAEGVILGDGGTVRFGGAAVTGGQVGTRSGGLVQVNGATTWNGVSFFGDGQVLGAVTLQLGALGMVNDGVVTINPSAVENATSLVVSSGSVTVSGGGAVVLNAQPANLDTAQIASVTSAWLLTNADAHTIRGTGRVHARLVNNATVQGDVSGRVLELVGTPSTNSGVMRATNGGILAISASVGQDAGGRIIADGGRAQLAGATITGGGMECANAGRFDVYGPSTLSGVTFAGAMDVHDSRNINLGSGGMTNNGVITINREGGTGATYLGLTSGSATIAGTGEIVLNAGANLDTAYVTANSGSWILTQGASHTIRGAGRVHVGLVNQGTVLADVAGRYLELASQPKANEHVMRAVDGAYLGIACIVTQGSEGSIVADDGVVQLSNATVAGGRMEGVNGGRFEVTAGSFVDGTALSGPLGVMDGQTLNVRPGGLVNNGVVTVNVQKGGGSSRLQLSSGAATIGGTGTIVLNASANPDTAYLGSGSAGWTMTLGPGQTLTGYGRIHAPVRLEGAIAPGEAGKASRIESYAPVTFTPTATAEMQIGGIGAGSFDTYGGYAGVVVDGTLRVSVIDGFVGGVGQQWTVMTGAPLSGRFDEHVLPPAPAEHLRWAVWYEGNQVIVRVTCSADYNGDGQIDFFDYLDFMVDFSGEQPDADFNGDNQVDFFDYLDFIAEMVSGCE
jgi:hypothetical protein